MKWYQVIECDKTVKKPIVCDISNYEEYGLDEYSFKKGEMITNWNENIYVKEKSKRIGTIPDDALQNIGFIPIFSERLVNAVKDSEIQGIQFLPIKVYNPQDELLPGFCIANLLNFIEAFDYEKSIYGRFDEDFPNPFVRGELSWIMKYVLKKDKLEGFDIIRLKDYKLSFFVSEKFKDLFVKNKFKGYSFIEIELS